VKIKKAQTTPGLHLDQYNDSGLLVEFLLEAGLLAGPLPQEVQVCPAHMGTAVHNHFLKTR
jgi:hypothetical protein